ncbi:MAG: hypothetical protein U0457_09710 [Candidatus Sericytochromatia bacterium]
MPKIKITTTVNTNYKKVFQEFKLDLLKNLTPPFIPFNILRFDGSYKNDQVHIELSFILFKQLWISLITEYFEDNEEIYFIDEGTTLPFFLKKWKHKHIITKKNDNTTKITDNVYFETPFFITDILFYPVMYLMFYYRKPIYKKYFN